MTDGKNEAYGERQGSPTRPKPKGRSAAGNSDGAEESGEGKESDDEGGARHCPLDGEFPSPD
eukprot:7707215-Pyramimonas_sp.AAC.1